MPAYCRLSATLDRRTGADGRSYGIGFALALPAEWNGRFLFQGGGGLNGTVAPPLGRTGQGDAALVRGFAVVTTDTGHRGEVFDASFMAEQQASLDFATRPSGEWLRSRSRSSRSTTAGPPRTRTSWAARPAGARAC
jgi:feruloyl esterase